MEVGIKSLLNSSEVPVVSERRWGKRYPSPNLAMYYWNGGTPKPHGVRDISVSGVYVLTQEPLFPGSVLLLTMQRDDLDESCPDQWIAVHALVTRRDPNGIALSFVFPKSRDSNRSVGTLANGATREEMTDFLSKLFENDDHRIPAQAPYRAESAPRDAKGSGTAETIRTSKVCICNLTRKSLVSSDMSVVDTVTEPLKVLVDNLSHVPSSGFWMTPFRGLPLGHKLSRFDVVFLDDNFRIAECAEQFAVAESASFRGRHPSALVLPSRTISSSHIGVGDQLKICKVDTKATHLSEPLCLLAGSSLRAKGPKDKHCLRDAVPPPGRVRAERASRQPDVGKVAGSFASSQPGMKTRFLRWLFPDIKPSDRRRGQRIPDPKLVAFYNAGGEPKAHKVGDVSLSGLYLMTDERWLQGTKIVITLQEASGGAEEWTDWCCVESEVIRWGVDGVGLEFVETNRTEILHRNELEKTALGRFLAGVTDPRRYGQHIMN